jgi:hypothetical protein
LKDGRIQLGLGLGPLQFGGQRVLLVQLLDPGVQVEDGALVPVDGVGEVRPGAGELEGLGLLGLLPVGPTELALGLQGEQPGDLDVRLGGHRVGRVLPDEFVERRLGLADERRPAGLLGLAGGLLQPDAGQLQRDQLRLLRADEGRVRLQLLEPLDGEVHHAVLPQAADQFERAGELGEGGGGEGDGQAEREDDSSHVVTPTERSRWEIRPAGARDAGPWTRGIVHRLRRRPRRIGSRPGGGVAG